MPRKLTPTEAREMAAARKTIAGGRPPGVRLRCGECRQKLTAREWRKHFTECPKRPLRASQN